ncbi:MAG: V-type ATP synthase subunit E [Deltaproteobacteria bacterium]|nr:V-type ATP synthase subunit E [Deltaproteobacteria bacterium]
MEMHKIREAILEKARAEAEKIVADAGAAAKEMIARAKKRNEERIAEERKKLVAQAERESARILARAALKARQTILRAKDSIIVEILEQAKKKISEDKPDRDSLAALIRELIDATESAEPMVLRGTERDGKTLQALLDSDSLFQSRISHVDSWECLGGAALESADGKVLFDSTYETRLVMLVPKILPDIGRHLFSDETGKLFRPAREAERTGEQ